MTGKDLNIDMESQPFTREGFLRFRKLFRMMVVALAVLGVAFVVLSAVVIWLGVSMVKSEDDIDYLKEKWSPAESDGVHGKQGVLREVRLSTTASGNGDFKLISPIFQGTGYWSVRGSLPFQRSDHQVAAVGDLVYIVGGLDADGSITDVISIYDTVLGTFSEGPKMPTPLARFAMAHVPGPGGDMLYLIGGLTAGDGDATGDVHILDINSGDWSKGPELNTPRSDFCAAFLGGKIYVAGGWPIAFTETLGSVEVLDIAGGNWEDGLAMPTPRGDCKCSVLSGEFIVLGGYYDPSNEWASDSFRGEVEAFDPESGNWRSMASLSHPRGDKAVVSLPGNRLLVLGGETHNRGQHTEVATHHVEEYIGDHDIWVSKVPLPLPRFRMDAAYVDGVVYLFGGHAICTQGDGGSGSDCPETDEIQAFFDVDHPDVFLLGLE